MRAILLFLALTLAGNPAATLLCDMWCHLVQPSPHVPNTCAHNPMAEARYHVMSKACGAADEIVLAILKTETARVASASPGHSPVHRFSESQMIAVRGRAGAGATQPAGHRPLSTTLRI